MRVEGNISGKGLLNVNYGWDTLKERSPYEVRIFEDQMTGFWIQKFDLNHNESIWANFEVREGLVWCRFCIGHKGETDAYVTEWMLVESIASLMPKMNLDEKSSSERSDTDAIRTSQ